MPAPVVDVDDVRVAEVGRRLRLAPEALDEVGVDGELGEQHLDGDLAVEQPVAPEEHVGHAAAPDALAQLVAIVDDRRSVVGRHCCLLAVRVRPPGAHNARRGYRPSASPATRPLVTRSLTGVSPASPARAASSTVLATGPARRPPVLAEISALVPEDRHGDGVARRVGRGEGDDPGVRPLRLARVVELGGAGLGGDGDAAVEGDAAARRAVLGDADHQVGQDVRRLRRDRRLPHLRLRCGRARCRRGRASARRRTASSSARRWRRWRRPSPCAAAPSAPRSGRSRGSPAAAGSGRGRRSARTCWRPGGAGRSAPARRRPSRRRPRPCASTPTSRAILANGMLQLRVNTSVRSPPHVVPSKFWIGSFVCGGTHSFSSGNVVDRSSDAVLQGDARRQDLERRARHVALLVRVGQQRVAGVRLEEREDVAGAVEVGVGDLVRVVAREAPHRLHRARSPGRSRRPSPRARRGRPWPPAAGRCAASSARCPSCPRRR